MAVACSRTRRHGPATTKPGSKGHLDIDDNDNSDFGVLAGMAFVFNADGAHTPRSLHFHGGYGFAMRHPTLLPRAAGRSSATIRRQWCDC
jgi:hypothetical protein